MVEGARLESEYMGNCVEGSNPSLSAIKCNSAKLDSFAFDFGFLFCYN